jgi:hypothetical protein
MAPVTIETTAQNSYYSAGNLGWSARSLFSYRTAIQQLSSTTGYTIGETSSSEAVAQSFTTSGAIDVNEIRVPIQKFGSPTDNVSLQIWSDSSSTPNASLATADNLYTGANISITNSWLTFQFAAPVSLSASTKYWIVVQRSGAVDAVNYYRWVANGTGVYAGGGRSLRVSGVWSAESAANDMCFQVLTETPSALYSIVQDTSGLKLRAYKSTDDGANWTEQDSANAPAVTNANYPYDATDTRSGPYIVTARMTATNTMNARVFNMSTDTWSTSEFGTTPPTDVSNERSIRVSCDNAFVTAAPGSVVVSFTDITDDADLSHRRATTAAGAWGGEVALLLANSTSASLVSAVVVDKASVGFQHRFFYDCAAFDYTTMSVNGSTTVSAVDLSISAADLETEHASAVYQIYQNASNVDTIIAAFIEADGTIQERIVNLEVSSASVTMAANNAVDTATTTAGRQLSTARYDGTNYIAVNVSGTGISYYSSTVAGTWSSATSHLSGLTACTLSQIASIPGVGLCLAYTDNGTAKFDIIIAAAGGAASMTVDAATASAAGEAVTLDAASKLTVTEATAPAAGQAVILKGQGTLGVTVATAPAQGEAVTLDAASKLTVTEATAPAAGQAVTLKGNVALIVTPATAPAAGEAVTLDAASKLTVTAATAPAQGEAVNLAAAQAASLILSTPATAPAAGENVSLAGQGRLPVTVATAPAQGEAVTFDAASKLTVTAATAPAQAENVNLASAATGTLTVSPATAPAAAQNVTLTGQGRLGVTAATAPAQGEAVTLDAASRLTVTEALAAAAGQAVTLDAAAKLTVAVATAPAQAEAVKLTVAANLVAGTATAPAAGQAVTLRGQGRMALTFAALAGAEGENVQLTGGTSIPGTLSVAPATAPASGAAVTLDAASTFAVTAATAAAQGEAVTFDAAARMTLATPATAPATGEAVTLTGLAQFSATAATAAAQGQDVTLDAAALMAITPALAGAAAGGLLEGGSIGDLWFRPRTRKVLTFRVMAEPVLAFDTEAEPVLAFSGKGNFDGD